MMQDERESGFVGEADIAERINARWTDIETLRVTDSHVIARACRYGRQWFLKGLRPEFVHSTPHITRLLKEFEIHSRLRNPHIVQAVAYEEVASIGPCIIMEWIEGKTLAETLCEGKLRKKERKRIMLDIIKGVEFLHSSGIIHRDIKPSNIMLRKAGGEVVLVDFGLADTDDYVELKRPAGTEGYISPEQYKNGGANTGDDVYSLGVIMSELCPRYSGLVARCIGNLRGRPKNASKLRRLFEKRLRRPKRIALAFTVLGILILGASATYRINALVNASKDADAKFLMLASENARNVAKVTELTDSLNNVGLKMTEAQQHLKERQDYDELQKRVVKQGKAMIDGILLRYDRNVFRHFTPENNAGFVDAQSNMRDEILERINSYCAGLKDSGLSEFDIHEVKNSLTSYYPIAMHKYQMKWIKQAYP